jgi:DNA-binding protein
MEPQPQNQNQQSQQSQPSEPEEKPKAEHAKEGDMSGKTSISYGVEVPADSSPRGLGSIHKDDNIIFIGEKPLINYVRGISVQLTVKKSPDVIIRSRGKFISKAVDIVEIAKRRFLEKEGFRVKDIKIASEEFEKESRKINVSTMDIIIGRQ